MRENEVLKCQNKTVSRRNAIKLGTIGLSTSILGTISVTAQESSRRLWRYEADDAVWTSPTVVDETVYAGSFDNNFYALDAESGEEKWVFETSGRIRTSCAMVVDGVAYVGSGDNNLYAINSETGEEKWRFETGGDVWSSPTVVDGVVFVGSDDGSLYAVDSDTGNEMWEYEADGKIRSGITVTDLSVADDGEVLSGLMVVFTHGGYGVSIVDAETGEGVREYNGGGDLGGLFPSSSVVDSGNVYTGLVDQDEDKQVFMINTEVDEISATSYGPFTENTGIRSTPTVFNDTVLFNYDGMLYALDAEDLEEQWVSVDTDAGNGSATAAEETALVASGGELAAFDVQTGSRKWESSIYDGQEEQIVGTTSSPIVVDGVAYIAGSDNSIYAIDTDIDSSSQDSRVQLGVLGHHGQYDADRATIEVETPGFGVAGAVGGIVGAGYALKHRLGAPPTDHN